MKDLRAEEYEKSKAKMYEMYIDLRKAQRDKLQELSEKIIRLAIEDKIEDDGFAEYNWAEISVRYRLTEDFMERYKDKLNWEGISANQEMSDSFILRNSDYIKFSSLINNLDLSRYCKEIQRKIIKEEIAEDIDNYYELESVGLLDGRGLYTTYMKEEYEKLRIMI